MRAEIKVGGRSHYENLPRPHADSRRGKGYTWLRYQAQQPLAHLVMHPAAASQMVLNPMLAHQPATELQLYGREIGEQVGRQARDVERVEDLVQGEVVLAPGEIEHATDQGRQLAAPNPIPQGVGERRRRAGGKLVGVAAASKPCSSTKGLAASIQTPSLSLSTNSNVARKQGA